MLRLDRGLSYDEYLEMAEEEHLRFIKDFNEESKLLDKDLEIIKDINEEKHIVVFAESRCKDAAKTIPFLLKLADLNRKISVKFLRMKGNEEVVEKLTGETKIPTFILLNNLGELERKYIEFPRKVKEILKDTSKEDIQKVVDNMRSGKYDSLIQEDLIRFIKGEGYEYIRFDK